MFPVFTFQRYLPRFSSRAAASGLLSFAALNSNAVLSGVGIPADLSFPPPVSFFPVLSVPPPVFYADGLPPGASGEEVALPDRTAGPLLGCVFLRRWFWQHSES